LVVKNSFMRGGRAEGGLKEKRKKKKRQDVVCKKSEMDSFQGALKREQGGKGLGSTCFSRFGEPGTHGLCEPKKNRGREGGEGGSVATFQKTQGGAGFLRGGLRTGPKTKGMGWEPKRKRERRKEKEEVGGPRKGSFQIRRGSI